MSKENYRRLGDYIREVDVRNRDLEVKELLGVSISKEFIPSIANTIGTDMSSYKIVKFRQFVYIEDTSRRGDKIAIALLQDFKEAIVSSIYTVFEVKNQDELLPEYLMMWFRRPEFDRYARFKSHGSAREIFSWEEMCDVFLPIPSIEQQRKIVAEYETISRRIRLNKQIITRLEETAQTLYRKMFVDEIDKENLPEGWRMGTLEEIADFKNGKAIKTNNGIIPIYGGNGIVGYTESFNAKNVIIIGRVGINCGNAFLEPNKCWVNDNAMMAMSKSNNIYFLYWLIRGMDLNSQSEGSGQPLLTQVILNQQECLIPSHIAIKRFDDQAKILVRNIFLMQREIIKSTELQSLLLAKMGQ
ncbi:restriction endonuclease subunit S [Phocaeicola plebeius]|uniref:Restriction endonuclease subunit S n=1 Tax=Phocaeicola plebeius TaxID=310297 RepID=A0A414FUA2_9BACT|nr:restriction endonuclease subunit S [Phocaeicola plebeius]RHD54494.1 restriction endonuclease subunit S [Phocaeicola plebeius]